MSTTREMAEASSIATIMGVAAAVGISPHQMFVPHIKIKSAQPLPHQGAKERARRLKRLGESKC